MATNLNRKLSQGYKNKKMEVLISEIDKATIDDTAKSLNMTTSEFVRETLLRNILEDPSQLRSNRT
jgi:hypothetical protein